MLSFASVIFHLTFLRFFHDIECISISSLNSIPVCILSSVDRHLECFHLLTVMSKYYHKHSCGKLCVDMYFHFPWEDTKSIIIGL